MNVGLWKTENQQGKTAFADKPIHQNVFYAGRDAKYVINKFGGILKMIAWIIQMDSIPFIIACLSGFDFFR